MLFHVYRLGSIVPESFLPIILVDDLDENIGFIYCGSYKDGLEADRWVHTPAPQFELL